MEQSTSDLPEAGSAHPPPVAEEPPEGVGLDPRRNGDAEAIEEEADENDPDAGIEVYEGSSIKRKVGVLKKLPTDTATLSVSRVSKQR